MWPSVVWGDPVPCLDPLASDVHDIAHCRRVLRSEITSHIPLVDDCVRLTSRFLHVLNTSPEYVVSVWHRHVLSTKASTLLQHDMLFRAVRMYERDREEVLAYLPLVVTTGVFEITLGSVRDRLVGVITAIINGLVGIASAWCNSATASVGQEVIVARARIRARCRTVELAVEVETFAAEVPGIVQRLGAVMAHVTDVVDILANDFR